MIIKRVGGKYKITDWICDNIPSGNIFVDVFGGSGVVLDSVMSRFQNVPRQDMRFVFNDLDDKIYNLFKVLRDNPLKLAYQILSTPYSRKEFNAAIGILSSSQYRLLDDIERARIFVIANRQSFGATMSKPWSITKDGEINYKTWDQMPDIIVETAKKWKSVYLECLDYKQILDKWDSERTVFYLDPPYEGVEKSYYDVNKDHGFDHIEMFKALQQIRGSYAVSYYGGDDENHDTDVVRKYIESGCRDIRLAVKKHLAKSDKKTSATEILLVKGKHRRIKAKNGYQVGDIFGV
jgi:DNA adenine methylase